MSTKLPSISDSQFRPLYLYEVVPVEHIRQAGFQPTKCAPFRAVRARCQSALNFDPLSASNVDPLELSRPGAA